MRYNGERAEEKLSNRFLSVAVILLCMGGVTLWNTSGILSSFVWTLDGGQFTASLESLDESNETTLFHQDTRREAPSLKQKDFESQDDQAEGQSNVMRHLNNTTTDAAPRRTEPSKAGVAVSLSNGNYHAKEVNIQSKIRGRNTTASQKSFGGANHGAPTANRTAVSRGSMRKTPWATTNTGATNRKVSRLQDMINQIRLQKSLSEALPRALQPITSKECCDKDAKRACLDRAICNNTLYPFRSQDEAELFEQYIPTKEARRRHYQRCQRSRQDMAPPTKWCQSNHSNYHYPFGCSHYSMGGGSGPYDRVYLFPEGKLAFCGVPKAGITQWLQFLRFTLGAKDYQVRLESASSTIQIRTLIMSLPGRCQSEPYYKYDAMYLSFDKLRPKVQRNIWYNDDSWTKAILIREPAERLLSAYLDKIKSNKPTDNRPFGPNVTFAEFIDIIAMKNITKNDDYKVFTGLSWNTDPHWRPQAWSCGLSDFLPRFDYVGGLDKAAFHTKALLQKVGLWEPYGKLYRVSERSEKKGNRYMTWPPEPLKDGEVALGFQQQTSHDIDLHSRGTKKKLDEYYSPELMAKVKKLYWMDFALWDAVQAAGEEGIVSGKDIAPKLNPECSA